MILPGLFEVRRTDDYDEGFALHREVGPAEVRARAAAAEAEAPEDAVFAGVSMGACLVGAARGERPRCRGALLIAGGTEWATTLRPDLPVQAHIALPDPFDPEQVFEEWVAANPGVSLDLRRYENAGHYFLDPALPDFDADAARTCRAAMQTFLAGL